MQIKKISHDALLDSLHEAVNAGRLAWVSMASRGANEGVLSSAKNKKFWTDLQQFVKQTGKEFMIESPSKLATALATTKVLVGTADNAIEVVSEALPAGTKLSVFVEAPTARVVARATYLAKRLDAKFPGIELNLIVDAKTGTNEAN